MRFMSTVGTQIAGAFGLDEGPSHRGPGGWWIFFEPECHLLLDRRVFVPDIAGWRRERMPKPAGDEHKIEIVPDWVCEVLSPSTQRYDYLVKMPRYLSAGVPWVWIVDPVERRVDVWRAQDGEWVEAGSFQGDVVAKIPPFEELELDLSLGWSG